MKEYNAYETGSLVHTVRVTLMQEDYIGHVSYEVPGNCKGAHLLDPNDLLGGYYPIVENDCDFRCIDEDFPYYRTALHNAAGDTCLVEGDENDILNQIISIEITAVREDDLL